MSDEIDKKKKMSRKTTKFFVYFIINLIYIFTNGYSIDQAIELNNLRDHQTKEGAYIILFVLLITISLGVSIKTIFDDNFLLGIMDFLHLSFLYVPFTTLQDDKWLLKLMLQIEMANPIIFLIMIILQKTSVFSGLIFFYIFFQVNLILQIGLVVLQIIQEPDIQFFRDIFKKIMQIYIFQMSLICLIFSDINAGLIVLFYIGIYIIELVVICRYQSQNSILLLWILFTYDMYDMQYSFEQIEKKNIYQDPSKIPRKVKIVQITFFLSKLVRFLIIIIPSLCNGVAFFDNNNIVQSSAFGIYFISLGAYLIMELFELIKEKKITLPSLPSFSCSSIFFEKKILVGNETQLLQANKILNKSYRLIRTFHISMRETNQIDSQKIDEHQTLQNIEDPLIIEDNNELKYQLFLTFWKGVSKQIKEKKKVNFNPDNDFSVFFDLDYFNEVENLDFYQVFSYKPINIEYNCLLTRLLKGMILNQTSWKLIFKYLDKTRSTYDLREFMSYALPITLFYRDMQRFIPVIPAFVLYDLYTDD